MSITQYQTARDDHTGVPVSPQDPLPVTLASAGTATPVTVAPATYTDRSGNITAGGTAQTLMAANAARRGWRIMNLSSEKMYINDKGATAVSTETGSSFTVLPGQMYESPASGASAAAISIKAATTSSAFEAAEW